MSGFAFKGFAVYAQNSPEIRGYLAGVGNIQLSICPENIASCAVSLLNVGFHSRATKPGTWFAGLWITVIGVTVNILVYNRLVMPKVRQ